METIKCQRCQTEDQYYTQPSGPHLMAVCNHCNKYIKFVSQGVPPMLYFGKYKGRQIASLVSEDEINYLKWLLNNGTLKPTLKNQITEHLVKLNRYG